MSRTDDQKLLTALEAELVGLLRTKGTNVQADPDKVVVTSSTAIGQVASRLDIDSDRRLWEVLSRLRTAGMFLHHKGRSSDIVFELHAAATFLNENADHPVIRQLVTLVNDRMTDIAALQAAFAVATEEPPNRQAESEIS